MKTQSQGKCFWFRQAVCGPDLHTSPQTLQGHFYYSFFLSQSQLLSYPSSHGCQAHSNSCTHCSVTHERSPAIVPSPGGMGKSYFVISTLQTDTRQHRQWCSAGKQPCPRLHIIPSPPAPVLDPAEKYPLRALISCTQRKLHPLG